MDPFSLDSFEISPEQAKEALAEAKKQQLKLLQEKHKLLSENRLRFFVPSKKQHKFFAHAGMKRRAIFAGNRFGKSTAGAVEDVCWLLGERPFFDESDPLRYLGIPEKGVRGLCIAEDWSKVGDIFTNPGTKLDEPGKIISFLPKNAQVEFHKNPNGIIDEIYVTVERAGILRKSVLIFETVRSYLNNPRSAESSAWDFIHLDEPVPEDMWKAVSRGLMDNNGSMWCLVTSLYEPWMYYYFSENALEDEETNNFWWLSATTDDNPTLSSEAKEAYFSTLDPIEIECRRKGKPLVFGNLVIPNYDESIHLWDVEKRGLPSGWKDAYTPSKDYMCVYAIDTHPQTPTAVLFVAVSPNEDVFVYDELWIGGQDKDRMSLVASEVLLRANQVRVEYALCEPAAWIKDPETGRCYADVFFEHGLNVCKASKERSWAIRQMRSLFAGPRRVYILSHCRNVRGELKKWAFTSENKPADKNDHFCENLGRIIIHDNLIYRKEYTSSGPRKDWSLGEINLNAILAGYSKN